ncbi:MAG: hypothetical protein ACNA77_06410 [Opitutales bacterium]
MKKLSITLIASLSIFQLSTSAQLYEGFNADASAMNERVGFMTGWHRMAGEVSVVGESLKVPGLAQSDGAIRLEKRGEALAQISANVSGTYYGSFRFRSTRLNQDSLIALLLAGPNLEELTPKTANISILAKGWRNEHGALLSEGKLSKTTEGAPIEEQQTYLVLFKVVDGNPNQRLIESWILNAAQIEHFAKGAFTESELNGARLGVESTAVMQRAQLKPKRSTRLALQAGDVIACVAKFNPETLFDEIRISSKSLREAAGVL